MVAVIDRDRLTAYGMALLLRDWGYESVVGVSAAEIFGRTEGAGRRLAAIVADDRGGPGGGAAAGGRTEAAALAQLARRAIPTIVLVSTPIAEPAKEMAADRIVSLPKPVEPNVLRDLLRNVMAAGD
jgi:DNA-binding NarL/FixJ family response regulator